MTKQYKKLILSIIVIVTGFSLMVCNVFLTRVGINTNLEPENVTTTQIEPYTVYYVANINGPEVDIINMALDSGFDYKKALAIAKCESQYGKFKFNKKSSAKGIYQFIDKTWENYCDGDVLNDKDNIKCFLELYEEHEGWWECS